MLTACCERFRRPGIAVSIAAAVTVLIGCGSDDVCGPEGAPVGGLNISAPELQTSGGLVFGDGTTSANNDCSVDEAPTSLTIDIAQLDPLTASRRQLILCVPRPDRLDQVLGLTDDTATDGVQVIDIFAEDGDCFISIDRTRAVSGTASFSGACENGTNAAGYALNLNGEIPVTASCMGTDTALTLTLAGEIAIRAL